MAKGILRVLSNNVPRSYRDIIVSTGLPRQKLNSLILKHLDDGRVFLKASSHNTENSLHQSLFDPGRDGLFSLSCVLMS